MIMTFFFRFRFLIRTARFEKKNNTLYSFLDLVFCFGFFICISRYLILYSRRSFPSPLREIDRQRGSYFIAVVGGGSRVSLAIAFSTSNYPKVPRQSSRPAVTVLEAGRSISTALLRWAAARVTAREKFLSS